jgi:CheY-like chemotaxis protein
MEIKREDAKVLIVDDEEIIRKIMIYAFKERGFIAKVAKNGKEALKKVAQDKPNIIILDIRMPEMDGIQTCKRLREDPDTQDIPIIFLSAQRPTSEAIQDMPGAAIEHIEKPCNLEYLFKRVDNLITE